MKPDLYLTRRFDLSGTQRAVFFEEWLDRRTQAIDGLVLTKDGTHGTPEGYAKIATTMLKTWNLL